MPRELPPTTSHPDNPGATREEWTLIKVLLWALLVCLVLGVLGIGVITAQLSYITQDKLDKTPTDLSKQLDIQSAIVEEKFNNVSRRFDRIEGQLKSLSEETTKTKASPKK